MSRVAYQVLTIIVALAAAIAGSPTTAQITYNAVPTTGHDQDIVLEVGLADGTPGANGEHGSRQFYQNGISTQIETHKMGLMQTNTGFVSTLTTNAINFDFAPFTGNNILKFDATNQAAKSLTLTVPAPYSNLAFIYSGGSLNGSGGGTQYQGLLNYTIHYAGGATQTGTIKAADWGANFPLDPAVETFINAGRINAGASGANPWPLTPDAETTAGRWRILVTEIATTSTANVLSVEFGSPMQHANATPDVLDPLGIATPTGGTSPITGGDVSVFGIAGATGGGGGTFNAADFDHLNGVNGVDLGIWRSGYATGTTNAQGNADADSDVDGNDFVVWQRNLGATAVSSIPEPASVALAMLAFTALGRLRFRAR